MAREGIDEILQLLQTDLIVGEMMVDIPRIDIHGSDEERGELGIFKGIFKSNMNLLVKVAL